MSNISLYGGRSFGQVSKSVARETQSAITTILANAEIANTRMSEAEFLFARSVNNVVNGFAACAEGERQVPGSGVYTAPLLRSYSQLVGEIVQRGVR